MNPGELINTFEYIALFDHVVKDCRRTMICKDHALKPGLICVIATRGFWYYVLNDKLQHGWAQKHALEFQNRIMRQNEQR